jgi:hypothetical protein
MNMPLCSFVMATKKKSATTPKKKGTELTISDVAKTGGANLAKERGTNLTQLVERLIRQELVRAGKLPPEAL